MNSSRLTSWISAGVSTLFVLGCATPYQAPKTDAATSAAALTVKEVDAAQQAWCDGLLSIAKAHAEGRDYKPIAAAVLSNNYNYDYGPVLFRPTLTFGEQTFRMDREAAAAYFIGGNPKFPNDSGFALKPWVGCRYTNAGVLIDGDFAATMGNVYLTDAKGNVTMVDKLFVFRRGNDGKLRIIVHKSVIPNPVPK